MKPILKNQILKLALVPLLAAAFGALVVLGIYFAMGDASSPLPTPNAVQQTISPKPVELLPEAPKILRFESLSNVISAVWGINIYTSFLFPFQLIEERQ